MNSSRAPVASAPVKTPQAAVLTDGLFHLAWRRRWRVEVPELAVVKALGQHVVCFGRQAVYAVDRGSGQPAWSRKDVAPIEGQHLIVSDRKRRLAELDPDSGALLWRAPQVPESVYYHRATLRGQTAYVSTSDGAVTAVDRQSGRRRWVRRAYHGDHARFQHAGDLIWICADDGFALGVNADDGGTRVQVRLMGHPFYGPKAISQGVLVGTQADISARYWLTLLDAQTGKKHWHRTFRAPAPPRPAVGEDRCAVVVERDGQPHLELLSLETGETLWRRPLNHGNPTRLALLGRHVLSKGLDGAIDAWRLADGAPAWRLPGEDLAQSLVANAPILHRRGLLLIPGTHIRAVDPSDGRVVHTLDCEELRPSWVHAFPDNDDAAGPTLDFVLVEDLAVARYALEGHLALLA